MRWMVLVPVLMVLVPVLMVLVLMFVVLVVSVMSTMGMRHGRHHRFEKLSMCTVFRIQWWEVLFPFGREPAYTVSPNGAG